MLIDIVGSVLALGIIASEITIPGSSISVAGAYLDQGQCFKKDSYVSFRQPQLVEQLGKRISLSRSFKDAEGNFSELSNWVNKPTIIIPIFYHCNGVCLPSLGALAYVLEQIGQEAGVDYQVLTVSIDPRETTEQAKEKKRIYMEDSPREFMEDSWKWLLGTQDSVCGLMEELGFHFQYVPETDQYLHTSALIILDETGQITRYIRSGRRIVSTSGNQKKNEFYDEGVGGEDKGAFSQVYFIPQEVSLSLMDAEGGIVGPTMARVLNMCYTRSPDGQVMVLNLLPMLAIFILAVISIFAVWLFVYTRRYRRSSLSGMQHGDSHDK